MRGIAIFLAVFSTLPVAVVYPFVGVLIWAWLSFMSPHREAFDFSVTFPFVFYAAVTTFGAWMLSAEPKKLPNQLVPGLLIAFALLVTLTTYLALDRASAYPLWDMHIKTLALALVVMGLVQTKTRIQAFLWVIALSVGYYAVKGGGFVLFTGSAGSRIFGPAHSIIADNNNLSLAMVVSLPILHYLRTTSANPYVKIVCLFTMAMTIVAIIGTYSRGGMVGLVVVALAFLLLSRHKVAAVLVGAGLTAAIITFAPQEWKDRMATTQDYKKDRSAEGRLEGWQTSWNLASDRPFTGGGFGAIEHRATFHKYRAGPKVKEKKAPHSIYFQVLGDHGFLGLFVYVSILAAAAFNLFKVQRATRMREELVWANTLSRMLLVSIIGYATAGTFLSMAYYDVFFCLVALSVTLRVVVAKELSNEVPDLQEQPGGAGELVPAWRLLSRASAEPLRRD